MIIPIRFRDFFGELVIQKDETAQQGVRQSHAVFPATFIDGAFSVVLEDTRVILYEPAADHPRQNIELRYTFHDREVLQRLSANNILRLHPRGLKGADRTTAARLDGRGSLPPL